MPRSDPCHYADSSSHLHQNYPAVDRICVAAKQKGYSLSTQPGTVKPSPRAHQVMMIGGVEPALGRAVAGEGRADQYQRGAGDARLLHLGTNVAEGAADQQLVGPAQPLQGGRFWVNFSAKLLP